MRLVLVCFTLHVCGSGLISGAIIGCYNDDTKEPDLPKQVLNQSTMDQDLCSVTCFLRGFRYAGIQTTDSLNYTCGCGNLFGRHGVSTNCNQPCPGSFQNTICGGLLANIILDTSLSDAFPSYFSVGCYQDNDLLSFLPINNVQKQEDCVTYCLNQGYRYAGIRATSMCQCSTAYGYYDADTKCGNRCSGDQSQACGQGGPVSFTVLDTGLGNNIAANKSVLASSTDPGRGNSSLLVDGMKIPKFCSGWNIFCTLYEKDPWIAIDLGATYNVTLVNIITDTTRHSGSILTTSNTLTLTCDVNRFGTEYMTICPTGYMTGARSDVILGTTTARFIASTTDDWMETDSRWKCADCRVADAGPYVWWADTRYNDSTWLNAVVLGSNDGSVASVVPGISRNASWITAAGVTNAPICCRGYFGSTAIHFYPFNIGFVNIYIDGLTPPSGNPSVGNSGTYYISPTASVLAIQVSAPIHQRLQFLVSSDDDWVLTNRSWKCLKELPYGPLQWFDINYDDSQWSNAEQVTLNDGVTYPPVAGISARAWWISAYNTTTTTQSIYCRFYFGRPLHNFQVGVTDVSPLLSPSLNSSSYNLCGVYRKLAMSGSNVNVTCASNTPLGRYVVIQQTGRSESMCMCEVEVYVRKAGAFQDNDLAAGRWATQSSFANGYSNAASPLSGWDQCTMTNTELNPYWAVDFGRWIYVLRVEMTLKADARYVVVINTDNWLTNPLGTPREKSICAMYPGSLLQSTNSSVSLVCPDSTLPGRYLIFSQLSTETAVKLQLTVCRVSVYANYKRSCLWTITPNKKSVGSSNTLFSITLSTCQSSCLQSSDACLLGIDWNPVTRACSMSSSSDLMISFNSYHYNWTCANSKYSLHFQSTNIDLICNLFILTSE